MIVGSGAAVGEWGEGGGETGGAEVEGWGRGGGVGKGEEGGGVGSGGEDATSCIDQGVCGGGRQSADEGGKAGKEGRGEEGAASVFQLTLAGGEKGCGGGGRREGGNDVTRDGGVVKGGVGRRTRGVDAALGPLEERGEGGRARYAGESRAERRSEGEGNPGGAEANKRIRGRRREQWPEVGGGCGQRWRNAEAARWRGGSERGEPRKGEEGREGDLRGSGDGGPDESLDASRERGGRAGSGGGGGHGGGRRAWAEERGGGLNYSTKLVKVEGLLSLRLALLQEVEKEKEGSCEGSMSEPPGEVPGRGRREEERKREKKEVRKRKERGGGERRGGSAPRSGEEASEVTGVAAEEGGRGSCIGEPADQRELDRRGLGEGGEDGTGTRRAERDGEVKEVHQRANGSNTSLVPDDDAALLIPDPSAVTEAAKGVVLLEEGTEGDRGELDEVATREGNVVGKLDDGEGDEEGGGFLQEEAVFRGDTEAGEETGLLHARKVGNVRDEGGVGRGEVRGTIKLSKESGREGGGAGARKGEGEVREGDKGFCPLAAGDDGEVKRGVELPVDGQRGKGRAGGSNGRREEFGESERVNGRGEGSEEGEKQGGGERSGGRGKEEMKGGGKEKGKKEGTPGSAREGVSGGNQALGHGETEGGKEARGEQKEEAGRAEEEGGGQHGGRRRAEEKREEREGPGVVSMNEGEYSVCGVLEHGEGGEREVRVLIKSEGEREGSGVLSMNEGGRERAQMC
ncbi:hypothetical protein CYMTET_42498 [Cymbomonas tetramitiformis]|uniref:Uncharacterized protein n=1 Tax=Cymbomonas tetramitiformis TaxID=36881 RepID=A0AAE0C416_9CHLO|nr:hypothetical protein CYMTET_42498 [Cymbomonas tetramitiformis]